MNSIEKRAPLVAFCLYFIKMLIVTPSTLTDSSILLILGSVMAFYEFKFKDNEIKKIKTELDSFKKELDDKMKEMDSIKSYVSGIKLSNSMRTNKIV